MTLEDLYALEEIMQEAWENGISFHEERSEKLALLGGYWAARQLLVEGLKEHKGKLFSVRPSNFKGGFYFLEYKE